MIGSMIAPIILSIAAPVASPPAAPPPPACDAPERHQLDFWIGEWDVFPAGAPTTLIAHSRVESMAGGCAVREKWMPLKGGGGGSISAYVPELGRWRQTWADATGSWVEFTGGVTGDGLAIAGIWPQPGKPRQMTRMTYRRLPDGAVEQSGATSDDNGKTWQPGFDFIYRRHAASGG